MRIEIDHDGYPTDESIKALEAWSGPVEQVGEVLDAVGSYLERSGYGLCTKDYDRDGRVVWEFATGGWSGCEQVIGSIPLIVHALAWESSRRGGQHIYKLAAAKGE